MGNRFPLPPTPYPLPATRYLLTPISFFSSLLCVFAPLRFFLPRVFFLPSQARQEQKRGMELLV